MALVISEEFKNYAGLKPEYASIFCRYHEVQSSQNLLEGGLQCPEVESNHSSSSSSNGSNDLAKEVKVNNHHDPQNQVKVNHVNDKFKSE